MELLTYLLLAVLISRLGGGALGAALLAAVAPEVDRLAVLFGDEAGFVWHRGPAHSLVAVTSVAALLAFGARGAEARRRTALVAFASGLAHVLLDATHVAGAALAWPFRDARFAADWLAPDDPYLPAVLILFVAGPLLGRLVSSEIGEKAGPGKASAVVGLVLAAAYILARQQLHQQALDVLEARLYLGQPANRVAALPSASQPLEWQGLVQTGEAMLTPLVSLADGFDPESGRVYYPPEPGPALDGARRSNLFRRLSPRLYFVVAEVIPRDEQREVRLEDLRHNAVLTILVTASGEVISEKFRLAD